jgi:hypothetical protein
MPSAFSPLGKTTGTASLSRCAVFKMEGTITGAGVTGTITGAAIAVCFLQAYEHTTTATIITVKLIFRFLHIIAVLIFSILHIPKKYTLIFVQALQACCTIIVCNPGFHPRLLLF